METLFSTAGVVDLGRGMVQGLSGAFAGLGVEDFACGEALEGLCILVIVRTSDAVGGED